MKKNSSESSETLLIEVPGAVGINRLEREAGNLLELTLAQMLPERQQTELIEHLRRKKEQHSRDVARLVESAVRRSLLVERCGAVTVEALAEELRKLDPETPVMLPPRPDMSEYHATKKAFAMRKGPHPASPDLDSWRGDYHDAAIVCDTSRTWNAADFAESLSGQIGRVMFGYKGGEFPIFAETTIWVSETGEWEPNLVTGVTGEGVLVTRKLAKHFVLTLGDYIGHENERALFGWRETPCELDISEEQPAQADTK